MRRGNLLLGVLTLGALAVLIGLGTWQWQRMGEKAALIATINERSLRPAAPLPASGNWDRLDLAGLAYQPVTASGRFDHAREAHVFFSLPKPMHGVGGPGYLILTPLTLKEGGTVLVNRGFVPEAKKAATTRADGQISDEVAVNGLIRLPEPRGRFSNPDDPVKNVYYVRDPAAIARALGLGAVAPFIIDMTGPLPPGRLPVPGATQIDIPNNHFSYALTWWSLAGVLAVIALMLARGRSGRRDL